YVTDGLLIAAALLLFAGCILLTQRQLPTRALLALGIGTYLLVLTTDKFWTPGFLHEFVGILYIAISCLFLAQPDLTGKRALLCLFAARGVFNLTWSWATLNGFVAYVETIDQVGAAAIGWALVMAELARAFEQNSALFRDLAQREARIRRLFEANIIGVYLGTSEGLISDANDAFLCMLGYDREELISGHIRWTHLTPPEWRDHDTRAVDDLRRTGSVQPYEKEYLRKDGSRVPVLVGAASFEDGKGGVAFVLDLTERKSAEDELRASEERFRTLVQLSFDVYWETDDQHRFVRREYAEVFAHAQPPIGKPPWEANYLEPDQDAWREHRVTLEAHLPFREFEVARAMPDGSKQYVSVSGLPMFDKMGHFVGYRGVGRYITERKQAEEALRRNEAYLAGAHKLSNSGAFAYNKTRYLYWSEGLYRIWDFDPMRGLPSREACWQRVHPDDRDRVREEIRASIRRKQDYAVEFMIVLADGTLKHLQSIGHPTYSADGELIEVVGTTADVTERKKAQQERQRVRELESDLAHMNRLSIMGELTASLAHEILHPIATVRNNARVGLRLLGASPPNLGEISEALGSIVRDADRARDIVSRIREHIKKAPPRIECFALNNAVAEVIAMVRNAIIKHNVTLHTRFFEKETYIRVDRVQLQQVVLNLILNAVEAMASAAEGPRELSIHTEADANGVRVEVRDSGPGIDSENLERIFAPFYTTKISGLGMGLS
ncbi:MAG: PAS domain S-box protein, partial [Candidatus Eremiobacteraeota bacterium]|nr:PAS domain S-box protein [Candidatus Eremiobacteraeota bacterium]